MGGRFDREKARARARQAREAYLTLRCPSCGAREAHFVPPSLGDPGFYACEADPARFRKPLVIALSMSQAVKIMAVDGGKKSGDYVVLTDPQQLRGRRGETVYAVGGWRRRRDVEEWFLAFEACGVSVVEDLPR